MLETARWAEYYDRAHEIISKVTSAQIADVPPKEIIDNPPAFKSWVEQCKKINEARYS